VTNLANIVTYVLCSSCDNFTLCLDCFMGDKYTHHSAHAFTIQNESACNDVRKLNKIQPRLGPGRGFKHGAGCDSCKRVRTSFHRTNISRLSEHDINVSSVATTIFVGPVTRKRRQSIRNILSQSCTIISLPRQISCQCNILVFVAMEPSVEIVGEISWAHDSSVQSVRTTIYVSVVNPLKLLT